MLNKIGDQHLLFVDDDILLQEFFQEYFSQQGFEVSTVSDGSQMQALLQQEKIHLIILDVMMPGKDGFYWLRWLKQHHPSLPVLMLSAKKQDDDRIQGLESGANDYLAKPFNYRELLARIKIILSYQRHHNNAQRHNILKFKHYTFNFKSDTYLKDEKELNLTPIEANLLKLFCHKQNKLLSREELTRTIHDHEHNPLDRRIDVHITHLRKKLEDDPKKPQHIRTVWGKGYMFSM